MTAGRGISHAETSPAGDAGALRGCSCGSRCRPSDRDTAPDFAHHDDLPDRHVGRRHARRPARDRRGRAVAGPGVHTDRRRGGRLEPGSRTELPVEQDFEHAVLASRRGRGRRAPAGRVALVPAARSRRSAAGGRRGGGRAFLVGGEPFDEDLLMWWNFVARSHDEVVEARKEWTAAVAGADTRFGRVTA